MSTETETKTAAAETSKTNPADTTTAPDVAPTPTKPAATGKKAATKATAKTDLSAEENAVAPVVGSKPSGDAKRKLDEALAVAGATPAPTMVNGQLVVGKRLNAKGDAFEDDPDYAAEQALRAEDIFDRIGNAFPLEAQRLVVEELARALGLTEEGTQSLPDDLPKQGKSTASLRTDVSGFGAFAGGKSGVGAIPVAPGADGKPAEEVNE